jgi:hypothetical protein
MHRSPLPTAPLPVLPTTPRVRRRLLVLVLGFWLLTTLLALLASARAAEPPPLDDHPLDALPREVATTGPMRCPDVPLIDHRGAPARWHKPLRIHPEFARRIAAFETILAEVATRFYGRPPETIRHLGSYRCRRIARIPHLLSEHGVGNAIDVKGFAFPRLPRGAKLPAGAPKSLARAFEVTVLDHWDAPAHPKTASALAAAHHRAFLRALAAALDERPDIFRVMLGPGYPGHRDHFHFDAAPYRLVVW